tara:strand:- start:536 stop:730 length:195 start_codon:yes stop_codon:yes gene_type:complete
MNNEKVTKTNSKNIKRRNFYGVLAGAVTTVLSGLSIRSVFSGKKQEPEIQVSLHPQAVRREKRG